MEMNHGQRYSFMGRLSYLITECIITPSWVSEANFNVDNVVLWLGLLNSIWYIEVARLLWGKLYWRGGGLAWRWRGDSARKITKMWINTTIKQKKKNSYQFDYSKFPMISLKYQVLILFSKWETVSLHHNLTSWILYLRSILWENCMGPFIATWVDLCIKWVLSGETKINTLLG